MPRTSQLMDSGKDGWLKIAAEITKAAAAGSPQNDITLVKILEETYNKLIQLAEK